MSKMKCRVCGKGYEPCRSAKQRAGVFQWREVACSPECGAIYLQQIMESRGEAPKKTSTKRSKKSDRKLTEKIEEKIEDSDVFILVIDESDLSSSEEEIE